MSTDTTTSSTTEMFVVLTLQLPHPSGGTETTTWTTTVTVAPGATRSQLLEQLWSRLEPRWRTANVMFLSIEPNLLVGGAAR